MDLGMRMKRQTSRKPTTGKIILAMTVIGIVILAGWAMARQRSAGSGNGLPDTDTSFSVPTHVGQPAPAFTAIGVDGQPYTLTPGDGRPKVIVFYMGFG